MHKIEAEKLKSVKSKVAQFERLDGIEKLTGSQLVQFEQYLYLALDTVKLYSNPDIPTTPKPVFSCTSDFQLSEALGLFSDFAVSSGSDSSDSSLEFESSFYRFKTEEKAHPQPLEQSSEMEEIGELLGSISKGKPQVVSPQFSRFSFGVQMREENLFQETKERETRPDT